MCRTSVLFASQQGMRNMVLNIGLVEEVLLCAALCYIPPSYSASGTRALRFTHWLPGIPFSVFIFVYDEVRKFLVRMGDTNGNKFGQFLRDYIYW